MNKLILLRHGQSQWNLENRFTGWKDVSLTIQGINEARTAGKLIKKHNIFKRRFKWIEIYISLSCNFVSFKNFFF